MDKDNTKELVWKSRDGRGFMCDNNHVYGLGNTSYLNASAGVLGYGCMSYSGQSHVAWNVFIPRTFSMRYHR